MYNLKDLGRTMPKNLIILNKKVWSEEDHITRCVILNKSCLISVRGVWYFWLAWTFSHQQKTPVMEIYKKNYFQDFNSRQEEGYVAIISS